MIDATQLPARKPSLEERIFPGWRREAVFPYPIDVVRGRLRAAFASPITRRPGFPMAPATYEGTIENDRLEVRYTCYGRATLRYNAAGRIFQAADGTHFEMVLRPRGSSWQTVVQVAVGYVAAGVASWFFGASPLVVAACVLVFGTVIAAAFLSLYVLGVHLGASTAGNAIDRLLAEVVSGKE